MASISKEILIPTIRTTNNTTISMVLTQTKGITSQDIPSKVVMDTMTNRMFSTRLTMNGHKINQQAAATTMRMRTTRTNTRAGITRVKRVVFMVVNTKMNTTMTNTTTKERLLLVSTHKPSVGAIRRRTRRPLVISP